MLRNPIFLLSPLAKLSGSVHGLRVLSSFAIVSLWKRELVSLWKRELVAFYFDWTLAFKCVSLFISVLMSPPHGATCMS